MPASPAVVTYTLADDVDPETFLGGVVSIGDDRTLDTAAELAKGRGAITVPESDATAIVHLDNLPFLKRGKAKKTTTATSGTGDAKSDGDTPSKG